MLNAANVAEGRALLAIVKRSLPYRTIRSRVALACPSDSWSEAGLAFLVFDLSPAADPVYNSEVDMSYTVFVLAAESGDLLAARVITRSGGAEDVPASDLLVQAGR